MVSEAVPLPASDAAAAAAAPAAAAALADDETDARAAAPADDDDDDAPRLTLPIKVSLAALAQKLLQQKDLQPSANGLGVAHPLRALPLPSAPRRPLIARACW